MARRQSPQNIDTETADTPEVKTTETEVITETALQRTAEPEGRFSDAIREGASDARDAAADFFPAIGGAIHKGVYNGFYCVTYGLVFGALTVGRLIPRNNAMGEGVHDGFIAARKAFEASQAAETASIPLDEGLAPA